MVVLQRPSASTIVLWIMIMLLVGTRPARGRRVLSVGRGRACIRMPAAPETPTSSGGRMSKPSTGCCRQAWLTASHWWGSNARDLAWMALLVSGAVLVTFMMR